MRISEGIKTGLRYFWTSFGRPSVLVIETSSACQANCIMCARHSMSRSQEHMSFDTFSRVVDDARMVGVKVFQLSFFGEPLLDPGFIEKLRYLRQAIPDATVVLNTNGACLDERMALGLIVYGVNELRISIEGTTAREYEAIRSGLDFVTLVSNVSQMRKLRDEKRSAMRILVLGLNLKDHPMNQEQFTAFWGQFAEEIQIKNSNQLHLEMKEHLFQKFVPCQFPLREMVVLATGEVMLCNGDWLGELCFGNIKQSSIRQLWFSPRALGFRLLHLTGLKKLNRHCRSCPYRPFGSHFQDSAWSAWGPER